MIADLVSRRVAVLVVTGGGTPQVSIAQSAIKIPIVFMSRSMWPAPRTARTTAPVKVLSSLLLNPASRKASDPLWIPVAPPQIIIRFRGARGQPASRRWAFHRCPLAPPLPIGAGGGEP